MAAAKLARATVARGRTVMADHATAKRTIVNLDGKPIEVAAVVPHGPGEEVLLPEEEIVSLRALGFLVTPGVAEVHTGSGPTFGTEPKRIDAGE